MAAAISSKENTCAKNIVGVAGYTRDLLTGYRTKRTRAYESKPGQGKTAIACQILEQEVKKTGNKVHYLNYGIMPDELVGGIIMPTNEPGWCSQSIPEFWDKIMPGDVVILDEVDKKRHDQQVTLLELVQSKSINGRLVGKGEIFIVLLANRSTDRGGSYGYSHLIGNRVGIRQFCPADSEVLEYAAATGWHYMVQTYLRTHEGALNGEYLTTRLRNSTSRSWQECSQDIYDLGESPNFSDIIVTVASHHPDSVAQDFEMYAEFGNRLIPLSEVVKAPKTCRIPKGEDRVLMYLQLIMLCSQAQMNTEGRGAIKTAIWEYAKRFPQEFRTAIMPYMVSSPLPAGIIGGSGKPTDLAEIMEWKATREAILRDGK